MTGEEIASFVSKYKIIKTREGKIGARLIPQGKHDDVLNVMRENKQAIIDYINERDAAMQEAARARQKKIDAIEGLAELQAAIRDLIDWQSELEASFDGEGGGGVGLRPRPQYDIDALKSKYPAAAAYLRADNEASKANYQLAEIGQKARERIINDPHRYAEAIADMDAEIHKFTEAHLWD